MKLEHEMKLNRTEISMIEYWGRSFSDYEQSRVGQNTGELTVDFIGLKWTAIDHFRMSCEEVSHFLKVVQQQTQRVMARP